MFWGWYSSGEGRVRHGGGCIFLPFLLFGGAFYLFDGLSIGSIMGLIVVAVLGLMAYQMFSRARTAQHGEEKPKRHFDDEKPKRNGGYLERNDGELLEVIDLNDHDDSLRDEL